MILDCYRLARFYGQSPEVFLRMSLGEIRRHADWTNLLVEEINRQQEAAQQEIDY